MINDYIINLTYSYYYSFNYTNISLWIIFPEILLLIVCFLILLTNFFFDSRVYYLWSSFTLFFLFIFYTYLIILSEFSVNLLDFLIENFIICDYYFLFFKALTIGLSLIILILAKKNIYDARNLILNEFFFCF